MLDIVVFFCLCIHVELQVIGGTGDYFEGTVRKAYAWGWW